MTAPAIARWQARTRAAAGETAWRGHARIDVLAADPGLNAVSCGCRLPAPVRRAELGAWEPARLLPDPAGALGLLLLDALVCRVVGLGVRSVAELLGPGDLLRPWDLLDGGAAVTVRSSWQVLEPGQVAILDEPVTRALCRLPGAVLEVQQRAMQRVRSATLQLAVAAHPGLDDRVILTLWHLADRWGRVTADGVALRLPGLTHERLALLVAARRPSVSSTLKDLERRGCLSRDGTGAWLLHALPEELSAFAPPTAPG